MILDRLIEWAQNRPQVRAMLLTSSRAIPGAPVDIFSDYDVILVLEDVHPFYDDHSWLEEFGPVLAIYRDPLQTEDGLLKGGFVTQYENGSKIDFSLWMVEYIRRIAAAEQLPAEFDAGYRVLLDKDGLTTGLEAPTYRAYIPKPPGQADLNRIVEEFFLEAAYVAKFLWRDDLVAAKYILDCSMKQDYLLKMLEWVIEIDHNWSVKPGPYGRRLKSKLHPALWEALTQTYTHLAVPETWEALFATLALFRLAALQVVKHLNLIYPDDLDRRATAYLHKVEKLGPQSDLSSF